MSETRSKNLQGKEAQSDKARRANRVFDEYVLPTLGQDADPRAYVAIDLASKDFEIDREKLAAADRLVERHPEAKGRLWFRRVGNPVAHHIGQPSTSVRSRTRA